MKKITLITSEYSPMPAAAAARILAWVSVMNALGFSALVLTTRSAQAAEGLKRSFFPTPNNRASLPVRFLQEVLLGLDLGWRLYRIRKETDICMLTSPPFFMAFLCSCFARLAKVKYLFDVRDRYPTVLVDLGVISEGGFLERWLKKMEKMIYENAEYTITVTTGLLRNLQRDYPKVDFHLVRNGFDENAFCQTLLGKPKRNHFTVVYHGRLGRFYNSMALLRIIELVEKIDNEVRFLLIGDLPEEVSAQKLSNLEIMPALRVDDLAKQLVSCHLGICLLLDLPAMTSAFPAKAYDFIGAGLPMFAGPDGELGEFVRQTGCGMIFDEVCPEKIASEIVALKNDRKSIESMKSKVLEIRESYGRQACVREHLTTVIKSELYAS